MILKCINCDFNLEKNFSRFECINNNCHTFCTLYRDKDFIIGDFYYNNGIYNISYLYGVFNITDEDDNEIFESREYFDYNKESIIKVLDNLIFV